MTKKPKEKADTKSTVAKEATATATPPPSALATLREEPDRLIGSFAARIPALPDDASSLDFPMLRLDALQPAADLVECDGEYRLSVEPPGKSEKDVDVSFDGGVLPVTGKKEEKQRAAAQPYSV